MAIFKKRPLFSACMFFILFSVIGYFIPHTYKIIVGFVALVIIASAAILFICKKISNYTSLALILCSIGVCSSLFSSYAFFNVKATSYEKYYNKDHTVHATVIDENFDGGNLCGYRIQVEEIDGADDRHIADLECYYDAALEIGDRIILLATARENDGSRYGRYNERLSKLSDGIFVTYISNDESAMMISDHDVWTAKGFISRLNAKLSSILTSSVLGENGRLASAILLGNRQLVSNTTTRDFARAGVSHILAISGMHMGIIMGAVMMLLQKLRVKHSLIAVIMILFSTFYLAITGFSISATRSVLMLLFVYLSILFGCAADSLTSLSLAGVIILTVSPGAVLDGAFWMSFSATLGILVYMPSFNRFINKLLLPIKSFRWILKPVTVFVSAIAAGIFAIIPLIIVMCIFVREMSWFTVISSAILSIPTSLIILLSLIFIPLSSVPVISTALISAITAVSDFMISYCANIARMKGIVFSLNYSFAYIFAIIIGLCLIYSLIFKSRNLFISLTPFMISVALFFTVSAVYESAMADRVKATYLNCSATSDMLVLSNDREAVICDISNGSNKSFNMALDAVFESRATEIEAVILTRYTNSHSAALSKLFTSELVRELWIPYPETQDDYYKMSPIIDVAEKSGVTVKIYDDETDLVAFTYINIRAMSDKISRSSVPISCISINSRSERLTYVAPAFNEGEQSAGIEKLLARSDYIVFGNRGPKTKKAYTIPENSRAEVIAFADGVRAAYFEEQDDIDALYVLVPEIFEVYIEK